MCDYMAQKADEQIDAGLYQKLQEDEELELSKQKAKSSVDCRVGQTLEYIKQKREERTIYLLISTLANMMCAKEEIIIDMLTGYLWTKEEGEVLKRSA